MLFAMARKRITLFSCALLLCTTGYILLKISDSPQENAPAAGVSSHKNTELAWQSPPFNFPYVENISSPSSLLLSRGVHSIQIEQAMALGQLPPLQPNLTRNAPFHPQMRLLIATTWRTGSTFLAELLNAHPGVFYSFEPLHFIDPSRHLNNPQQAQQALQLISSIFQCNFLPLTEYLHYFTQPNTSYVWQRNTRLWNACQGNLQLCADRHFVRNFCQYFPIHLIKTVRLRLRDVESLLATFDNLRVVWLTRDPRGMFLSRDNLTWCQHPTCRDPATVCSDLWDDSQAFSSLRHKFPGDRLYHLRYEDIGLSPELEAKKLFTYLNLPYLPTISAYVKSHTRVGSSKTRIKQALQDPYATLRDSKQSVNRWKQGLSRSQQVEIQKHCHRFMAYAHYT